MKRRTILKFCASSTLLSVAGLSIWLRQSGQQAIQPVLNDIHIGHDPEIVSSDTENVKNRLFDHDYDDDVYLEKDKFSSLVSIVKKLGRLQKHVGHANFSLMSFDEMLKYAAAYTIIGAFSIKEKNFLEEIFNTDATQYGFMGHKVSKNLTARINSKDTVKVAYSGNYLYRGESLEMYQRLKKDVGENLVLTSGIRGIVKQNYLFLAKLVEAQGNLSRASRSLAPPGHSYHGVGDFVSGVLYNTKKWLIAFPLLVVLECFSGHA